MIKIQKSGTIHGGQNIHEALYALVQQQSHVLANGVADLTNNSGGTAGTLTLVTPVTEAADVSTSSAQKAATETALNLVKDALLELATTANAVATVLGIDTLTYNGGGTAADGTIGAITVAVTAATTGVQDTETNAVITAFNKAQFQIFTMINKLREACGLSAIKANYAVTFTPTVAAITVSGGTAGDPAVPKTQMDARLVTLRANIKTLADALVTITNTAATAKIVAQ